MTNSSHKAVAIVTLETQPLFSDCNCYAFSDIHGLCRQKLYTIENLYNSIYRRLRPLGIVRKQYASFRAISFIVNCLNNSQRRSALHYKKTFTCTVFFDTGQSYSTPRCADIQPVSQQATAASLNMSKTRFAVACPWRSTSANWLNYAYTDASKCWYSPHSLAKLLV